ncbi:hypothetical protein [Actinomyces trachealis]|uniref:hypothetical protein n=1 Tax=Actinomyces trachealis TaxID=2763540 RepID=UPI0018928DFC|nr:hypothetical protein [Actinomyces trachealis]
MLRTLFVEEARTQLARNAAVLGLCALILGGFLGLWWLLSDVTAMATLMQTGALITLVAMPLVVLAQVGVEYWQSMYGERGYLTQVIPVRGRTHFTAKVSYACVVALVLAGATLAGALAWIAILADSRGLTFAEALDPLQQMIRHFGGPTMILLLASMVLGLLSTIVEVAAVMSIGAQSRFNHMGFGAPMLGLVVLYGVNQILGLAAVTLIPLSVDITTGSLTTTWMLPQLLEAIRTGSDPTRIGVGSVLIGPLLAAVLSWWAVRAIEQHTSLR